jgi:hypothetical protein
MTSPFVTHPEPRPIHGGARRLGGSLRAAVVGGLVALFAPKLAHAQSQLELAWEAPAGCPQRDAVQKRVAELAGQSLRKARLRAEGRIVRVGGHYRLELKVLEGRGARDRTIESESCVDLAGAAAVTLGLLLKNEPAPAGASQSGSTGDGTNPGAPDNGAPNGSGADASESTTGDEKAGARATNNDNDPAKNESDAERRNAAERDRRAAEARAEKESEAKKTSPASARDASTTEQRHWNVLLRAPIGTLDAGPLPKPTAALGVGLGARYDEWRLLAIGRIFTDQTLWATSFSNAGARVSRASLGLTGCRGWRSGVFEFAPCVAVAVDRVSAHGVGAGVVARSERASSWAVGGGAVVHVYLADWLALVGAATADLVLSRPRLVIDGLGDVRRLGPARGGLALGSEWIF